jgi:hypothetical protein
MTKRWLVILFVSCGLIRLGSVFLAPAWYDESFTLLLSRLDLRSMLLAAFGDVHPPLWYLIVWPLGQLHAPIWALRLPSVLFSLAAMALYWQVLQELKQPAHVQAVALLLMTVMPAQLVYAMEARMYALLEMLVLGGLLAVLRKRWGWLSVCGILMLYTQYYGIFYLSSLCLAGALLYGRKHLAAIFYAGALAAFLFLPWVIGVMLPQMGGLSGAYWMQLTGPGMVLRYFWQAVFMAPQNAVAQIPLMLGGFAWIALGLVYAVRRWSRSTAVVVLMAFGPLLLAVLVSLVWQPVLHYRPLFALTPFVYLLMAGLVEWLFDENRLNLRRALYAACYVLPILLIPAVQVYLYAYGNKLPNSAGEMAYVAGHWQAGDIVYHYQDDTWINSTPDSTLTHYMAPECAHSLGGLSARTRRALGVQIRPLEQIDHRRAWVIWSDSPLDPACKLALRPAGAPLLVAADDEYVFEGLWLVEK